MPHYTIPILILILIVILILIFIMLINFFMKKAFAQEDLEAPPGQAGTEDELKQAS